MGVKWDKLSFTLPLAHQITQYLMRGNPNSVIDCSVPEYLRNSANVSKMYYKISLDARFLCVSWDNRWFRHIVCVDVVRAQGQTVVLTLVLWENADWSVGYVFIDGTPSKPLPEFAQTLTITCGSFSTEVESSPAVRRTTTPQTS